jgi:hypothetical protein
VRVHYETHAVNHSYTTQVQVAEITHRNRVGKIAGVDVVSHGAIVDDLPFIG